MYLSVAFDCVLPIPLALCAGDHRYGLLKYVSPCNTPVYYSRTIGRTYSLYVDVLALALLLSAYVFFKILIEISSINPPLRREGDSNPRYVSVNTLSKRARSATLPPLRFIRLRMYGFRTLPVLHYFRVQ